MRRKRLLVTGYGGFVAGSVVQQAANNWDVFALSRLRVDVGPLGLTKFEFDLHDDRRLRQVFEEVQPTAVIHTAAMANIDRCQAHPVEAEAINVGVTEQLTQLCQEHRARMIFCSTDTVFDGAQGMYVEDDLPRPLNFYGETKVRAERIVQDMLDNMVVARLSLVIGLPMLGAGNSFLASMADCLEKGIPFPVPDNEVRTPIDVVTLGRALLELADGDFTGILHLAGNTRLSRYEMAVESTSFLGFPPDLVQRTNSNDMPGRANRPNDASLDNAKAKQLLTTPMLSLPEGLRLSLAATKK
jgi:dTDP-4-dehydrorhamnose reductase